MTGGGLKRHAALILLGCGFGAVFLTRNSLGYLNPFMAADLALDPQRLGLLAAAFSLAWALSGFAITALTLRVPQRVLLVALLLALGLSSIAASFVPTFIALFIARLAGGLCSGPLPPILQSYAARIGSDAHRGLDMGVVQGIGGGLFGTVLAPLILVPAAQRWNWREAFLVVAVATIVAALLLARFLSRTSANAENRATKPSATGITRIAFAHAAGRRDLALCCLISVAMIGWLFLSLTFYPTYLIDVRQRSDAEMTTLMSVMGAGGLATVFLVPWLSDRFGPRWIMVSCCLLGASSPAALLAPHDSFVLLIAGMFAASFAGGTFPLFIGAIPSRAVTPEKLPLAIGLIQGIGEVGGGTLAPALAGWAAVHFNPAAPVQMVLGSALLAALLSIALSQRRGT